MGFSERNRGVCDPKDPASAVSSDGGVAGRPAAENELLTGGTGSGERPAGDEAVDLAEAPLGLRSGGCAAG